MLGIHSGITRNSLRCALVGVVALALATPTFAAEIPLTLADAQRRALARAPQLEAREHAVTAAREQAIAAGALPDPVLKLGIDNLPVDGPDAFSLTRDFMTMQRIGVMQEWTRADKRDARRMRYEREGEKARSEQTAIAAAIRRDTALAWIDRYYAEAILAEVVKQVAEAKLEIVAADAAFRSGRGTAADLFAAQGAAAALEDRASDARRVVATATVALARWVGPAADAPLAGDPPYETLAIDAATLAQDLEQLPELHTLALEAEVAAAEVRVAQVNRDPDWSIEVAYQQRGSAFSNMMSIGVSVPLPWNRAQRQDREVAAKLARVDAARALRADAGLIVAAQVRAWLAEWESGRERIALHDQKLEPLARDRTRATIAAYRGGKSTLADVLAARRAELEVHRSARLVERDTARAWAQLTFLGWRTEPVAAATRRDPAALSGLGRVVQ